MRRRFAIALLVLFLSARRADAEVVRDHPFYIAVLSAGALGGLGNSIAALVYAIDGRSFHAVWIGTTLFSSAVCGAFAGQLIVDAANGEGNRALVVTGIIGFLLVTLWPTAWVTRSALSEGPLGSRFDSEVVPEETGDPIETLDPTPPSDAPASFSWSWAF